MVFPSGPSGSARFYLHTLLLSHTKKIDSICRMLILLACVSKMVEKLEMDSTGETGGVAPDQRPRYVLATLISLFVVMMMLKLPDVNFTKSWKRS